MNDKLGVNLISVGTVVEPEEMKGTVAVVFDVLRASSTIVTALASGYRKVYPVVNVDEALQLAGERGTALAGERGGQKITGFPLGNSPLEFCRGPDRGVEVLVLTTSNGTSAIRRACLANKVLVGSILNARAVAWKMLNSGSDIRLVCAGSGGRYSLDDVLGAGFVLAEMLELAGASVEMDDLAETALCLARCYRREPLAGLLASRHGKKLVAMGQEQDLHWCARLNMYDLAPVLEGDYITTVD